MKLGEIKSIGPRKIAILQDKKRAKSFLIFNVWTISQVLSTHDLEVNFKKLFRRNIEYGIHGLDFGKFSTRGKNMDHAFFGGMTIKTINVE